MAMVAYFRGKHFAKKKGFKIEKTLLLLVSQWISIFDSG